MIGNALSIWRRGPRAAGIPGVAGVIADYDASIASSITVATGVSGWADVSGAGRHLAQATPAAQPAYSATAWGGTLPGITTDGVDDHLWNAATAAEAAFGDQDYVVAFAGIPAEFGTNDYMLSFGQSTGSAFDSTRYLSSAPRFVRSGGTEVFVAATGAVRHLQLVEARSDATIRLTVRTAAGTTSSSAARVASASLDRFALGGILRGTFGFAGGMTYSRVIVARAVTDATALLDYLEARWPLS